MGSKPNEKTSALLLPAGVFLLVLTFLPFVYVIPYYVNMILQASIIIFIGAHLSIPGASQGACEPGLSDVWRAQAGHARCACVCGAAGGAGAGAGLSSAGCLEQRGRSRRAAESCITAQAHR